MDFAAIDVETANPCLSSICQIGVALFRNGEHVDTWSTLVDPQDWFDEVNVSIHGIDEKAVRGAPTWPSVASHLRSLLDGSVVACHTHFDRIALSRACESHEVPAVNCRWIDTARVARRAWPDKFGKRGYGLRPIADEFGIQFIHHNAAEDARAAGTILVRACADAGLSIEEWFRRVELPIDPSASASGHVVRSGDPEGPLFGTVAVFTGALSITRNEAANLAAKVGCDVAANVTGKTQLLIVGDQDVTKLAGKSKSTKHLKAEKLIGEGQAIRILSETDFRSLVS